MTDQTNRGLGLALLALVILHAGVLLFRWPFSASNLENVPDSVEYVTGALHLVDRGTYDITINGRSFPPRYPPWFSRFVVAPAFIVLGPEPGNSIAPVFLFGLGGVIAAFLLGKRLSGNAGAWLSSLFLLALPLYRHYGQVVLTDVPATALILTLALLFVRMNSSGQAVPRGAFGLAALLVALSASWRPATASCILPFLWLAIRQPGLRRILATAVLGIPLAALAIGQATYNLWAIGSPWRGGYHLWCSVPYDYPSLTFSAAYLAVNVVELLRSGAGAAAGILAILYLLARMRQPSGAAADSSARSRYRSLWLFLLLGLGPYVVFHLYYFFPDARLFLPVAALMAVMAGGRAGARLGRVPALGMVLIQAGLVAFVIVAHYRQAPAMPERRLAAETIRRYTPPDAIVIAALDPVYLEMILGSESHRFLVPLSRSVEYASKVLCFEVVRTPDPLPSGWNDHRSAGLRRGGAVEAVDLTADENMPWLEAAVKAGRPVFLDTVGTTPADLPLLDVLRRHFTLTHTAWSLYSLTLPGQASVSSPTRQQMPASGTD